MRYYVELAGREHLVDLVAQADGTVRAQLDGRPVEVDLVPLSPHELSLRIDGHVLDLAVDGTAEALDLCGAGRHPGVRVASERTRAAERAAGPTGPAQERQVRSPMPGRVVKVLVAEGDPVAAGQPVVVVEAMKMENEVRARSGGVVARLHVSAGGAVEANAPLVSFR